MVKFIKDSLKSSVKIDTKALEVSDKYADIKLNAGFYCEMLELAEQVSTDGRQTVWISEKEASTKDLGNIVKSISRWYCESLKSMRI